MCAHVVTVNDVLDGQVALDIECLDRIYLNLYVPTLQVGGQVVLFLRHRGYPIVSPACLAQIGQQFRRSVQSYADANDIPMIKLKGGDRKIDVMLPHLHRAAASGRSQVAAVGVAQEVQSVFIASEGQAHNGIPWFSFSKADRRVTCYYFYIWDADFGPAFVKICAYFPYPGKVWVNGHEWAKQQARKGGVGFTELSNGFASCDDPPALQEICDRLGPGQIDVFVQRWLARLPQPFTPVDQDAGYWWETSMRQVEVSRTIVFTQPRHARAFMEALVVDNLDIGRPEHVELIFRRDRRGFRAVGTFKTRITRHTTGITLNAFYRHSRIKQYLKDGRALRIETVVDDAYDLGCQRRLPNLAQLTARARACNARLLDAERVGQGCVLASPVFERIARPTVTAAGRRAPAMRFGDPRVQALAGALCHTLSAVTGITNKSLRALMTGLLGGTYTLNQASYDLARLRVNGLLQRVPGRNLYTLTGDGLRFAIFYSKVHDRILRPLLAADQPQAPPPLRAALHTIDRHIDQQLDQARLPAAA
jgi:hypothetical protein